MEQNAILAIVVFVFVLLFLRAGIKIVPQSKVFVVERFGKYTRTLNAGLSVVVPFFDKVAHKVSILERQLPEFEISVITRDNVEVALETTVFYRVIDAGRTVYRIEDVNSAIHTAASSIVRSAAGKLELDDLQSSRESMNAEIARNLQDAADVWGVDITRTEIMDVKVDAQTKDAQRQQLNAERARRAAIAEAEGKRRSVELNADAELYEAKKLADAVRLAADAEAYAITAKAQADARQTELLATAIANNGQPAIDFEILKRQVDALAQIASSDSAKTIILPTDVTGVLGSLQALAATFEGPKGKG